MNEVKLIQTSIKLIQIVTNFAVCFFSLKKTFLKLGKMYCCIIINEKNYQKFLSKMWSGSWF